MSPPFNQGAPLPAAGRPAYDPSLVPWRGWWRGDDYVTGTGTWNPTASATDPGYDGSGSSSALIYTNSAPPATKPTAGPTLNGHATLSFDGTANRVASSASIGYYVGGAAPATTAVDQWTVGILFNVQAVTANFSNVWDNPMIIGDTSTFWGLYVRNSGGPQLNFMQWDGADKHVTVACSLSTWVFAYMTYDGTSISLDLGGGAVATTTAGNLSTATNVLRIGQALSNPCFQGYVAEAFMSNRYVNASRANMRNYLNARYGLSLP